MLGQNGCGKTTFIRMLAGVMKPDEAEDDDDAAPKFNISYKPQKIVPRFEGTVQMLLVKKCAKMYAHPRFQGDVIKPLQLEKLYDQEVKHLSGGELQRVAIALCLGKPADLYLIDEPSAYLDSEQRIVAAKVIKRFILNSKKTAYVRGTILSWLPILPTTLWSMRVHQVWSAQQTVLNPCLRV